jgi:hypothetical protein
MVIRLRVAPSDAELAALNTDFADICSKRGIWRTDPLGPERSDRESLDLPRIAFELDLREQGRFRELIDAVNAWKGEAGASPAPPRADQVAAAHDVAASQMARDSRGTEPAQDSSPRASA